MLEPLEHSEVQRSKREGTTNKEAQVDRPMRLENMCPRRQVEKMLYFKRVRVVGGGKCCSGSGPFRGRAGHRCQGSMEVGPGQETQFGERRA